MGQADAFFFILLSTLLSSRSSVGANTWNGGISLTPSPRSLIAKVGNGGNCSSGGSSIAPFSSDGCSRQKGHGDVDRFTSSFRRAKLVAESLTGGADVAATLVRDQDDKNHSSSRTSQDNANEERTDELRNDGLHGHGVTADFKQQGADESGSIQSGNKHHENGQLSESVDSDDEKEYGFSDVAKRNEEGKLDVDEAVPTFEIREEAAAIEQSISKEEESTTAATEMELTDPLDAASATNDASQSISLPTRRRQQKKSLGGFFHRFGHHDPHTTAKKYSKKLKNRNYLNMNRKFTHAAFGMFFAGLHQAVPRRFFVPGMAILTTGSLVMELLRYRRGFGWMNDALHFVLGSSLRKHEMEGKFTGSFYYFFGVTTTAYFFPKTAATMGMLQLALADPSASYFGRRTRHVYWSRIENGLWGFGRNKGVLGFLGGALFCFPFNYRILSVAKQGAGSLPGGNASLVAVSIALGVAGAFADLAVPTPSITMPERICGVRVPPFHVDDNFVVPLFSAFACEKIFDYHGWPQDLTLGKYIFF